MNPDDQPTDLATQDDICQAYESLSEAELYRIHKAASIYHRGSEYSSAEDLIGEVITRTMNHAAGGEGHTRQWKRRSISLPT